MDAQAQAPHAEPNASPAPHRLRLRLPSLKRADRPTRTGSRRTARSLFFSSLILLGVVAAALVGTGATYALWNASTTVNASTVTSGTTTLTINGTNQVAIAPASLALLSPGQQGVPVELKLANVGSTKLVASVTGVTVTTNTKGLADALSVALTTCNGGQIAPAQPLKTFTHADAYVLLPDKAEYRVCLVVSMNADAPPTVAGGETAFSINIVGTQVR